MNRIIAHTVIGVLWLATPWAAIAGETGMSHDDTVNPGAPAPHIAPPGGGNTPKPLTTNTIPITPLGGGAPPQAGTPPREVQPGEETPQTDDNTASGGVLRPPRGGATRTPGGGDGTQTEDELYVGRKAGGGSVSSGDEDEFEDFEIERRTVQGVSTPGAPSKGSLQGLQPGGGDGTQTEDELYVGRKLKDTPAPGDVSPGGTGVTGGGQTGQPIRRKPTGLNSGLPSRGSVVKPAPAAPIKPAAPRPAAAPTAKGPGAIVIPRENCGTFWTGWVADPNADVNPCPTNCERGERLALKEYKSGEAVPYAQRSTASGSIPAESKEYKNGGAVQYAGNYRCYLPERVVNQTPAIARRIEAGGIKGQNCGTFWTGRVDDPNADVNPCPKNCERGELQVVNRHRSGDALQYNMRYQCYVAEPVDTTGKLVTDRATPTAGGRTAGGATARAGADLATRPTAGQPAASKPTLSTTERPTGGPQGVKVAGDETVSTQPDIGGAPRELNRPAAADREVSTRNIVPGPTLLAVTGEDATTVRVSWRPLAGASGYKAHAAAKGINHSVSGQEVRQPTLNGANQPGLPDAITYNLSGLAPGVEHDVWVTVNYPDGRGGPSDRRTVTTRGAENPTGFMAFPIVLPRGSVRLEWQPRPGATHYFVEGSNLPRTQTMNTTFVVPDIRTVGTHAWTVIAVYPGGVYDDRNAPRASVTCALSASSQQVVCSRNRNP